MNLGHRTVPARLLVMVMVLSVGGAVGVVASPQWSGEGYRNQSLLRRHRVCVENQQYTHMDLCCTNCQAGTFVLRPCDRDLELGTCLPCEHGQTYTEHSNGMYACLSCTHCRTDEMETEPCSGTADTRCRCKPGTFCVPDQACEVCKRCARCKAGEEEVRRCTPFSNTLCRKPDLDPTENSPSLPTTPPAPPSPESIVLPVVVLLILIVVVGVTSWWFITKHSCEKPCSESQSDNSEIVKIPIDESGGATPEERQNDQNAGLEGEESRPESRPLLQETQAGGLSKASPPLVVEDEDRGLGDSLPNTTSSSQTSLSALPTAASSGSSPHHSPSASSLRLQPTDMDDPLQNRLVPLLGSERSLRKSFDLFDEYLDVRIHNKFFRLLGVSDNHIRIAEGGPPGDKVYDLLKSWMQREGLKADINSLLEALLSMDQRRSAESIAYAALQRGYYKHANDNGSGGGGGGAPCC